MRRHTGFVTEIGFALACLVAVSAGLGDRASGAEPGASANLAFTAADKEYHFDAGIVRGTLRPQGRSFGLAPAIDCASGSTISGGAGIVSHYRLLDGEARYGGAAWDWSSTAKLLPDGSVEATWTADKDHPLDLKAVYRWKGPGVLDVTTSVTASKDLVRFESFLASYFNGFGESLVYVKGCPETGGKPGLLSAKQSYGPWQMFPRDDEAVKTIQDGRWKRPPNPVDWKIMPQLAGPLAVRRDAKTGLSALVMAPAEDCFAVATPYGEEVHRSLYLSLLGRDLKSGQTATARARLVIGRDISDAKAIEIYEGYVKELHDANPAK